MQYKMLKRRVTDRIYELCSKAISMPESLESYETLKQLREELHRHVEQMRKVAGGPAINDRRHLGGSEPRLDVPTATPANTVEQTSPIHARPHGPQSHITSKPTASDLDRPTS
jgi:hypothetical protein